MPFPYTFQPRLVVTMATILFICLTLALSRWQFGRAEQKRALEEQYVRSLERAPSDLADIDFEAGTGAHRYRQVTVRGRYTDGQRFLIDNRMLKGIPGYWAVAPFRPDDANLPAVLVVRGWIRANPDRSVIPEIPPPTPGSAEITGMLLPDSSDAVELSDESVSGPVWQNAKIAEMGRRLGIDLLPMLVVAGQAPPGLEPVGIQPDFKVLNSVSYAWQWLSFALLAFCLYVGLNLRRRK